MPNIEVKNGLDSIPGTTLPGVAYIPPPVEKIPMIHDAIDTAFKTLPPGAKGGLFAIANETGINAAIVTTVGNGWKVETYIGRTWNGSTNYGAMVMKVW